MKATAQQFSNESYWAVLSGGTDILLYEVVLKLYSAGETGTIL